MRRRAFSLLELSVVLVIVGLVAGVALSFKQSAGGADCLEVTKGQLETINIAVKRYISTNDRLPLPALRTVGVEDPQYGREANIAALNKDASGQVAYGALPFQVLGLAPSYASDCWGNKFTYAATISLTETDPIYGTKFNIPIPNEIFGAITLKTSASTTVSTTAAYAVVSHGLNATGAVKANYAGNNAKWCSLGSGIESENCETSNAVIMAAPFNDGKDAGSALFDDVVTFSGKPERSVNGVCGTSAGGTCNPGIRDNDNGLTACNTTRTWDCNGAHGGTNALGCSKANPICVGCSPQSLSWGGGCVGDFPAAGHGATTPSVTNNNTSFTGDATAVCDNGTFTADGPCTPLPPIVNGACDNAVALGCSGGSPINDNGLTNCGTTRNWVCAGSNGGTNSGTCSKANGTCSSCAANVLTWGGGCSGDFPATANGATTPGVANNNSLYTGSATANCTNGTFSTPSGPCTPLVAEDGACDTGTGGACAAGVNTGEFDDNQTACGKTHTWTCEGRNGGASVNCSKVNEPCMCWTSGSTVPYGWNILGTTPDATTFTHDGISQSCTATFGPAAVANYPNNNNTTMECIVPNCDRPGKCKEDTTDYKKNPGPGVVSKVFGKCACAARNENWGSGCTGDTPAIADGTSILVNNTANGHSGSVTMSCSGGVLTQNGATCSVSGGVQCYAVKPNGTYPTIAVGTCNNSCDGSNQCSCDVSASYALDTRPSTLGGYCADYLTFSPRSVTGTCGAPPSCKGGSLYCNGAFDPNSAMFRAARFPGDVAPANCNGSTYRTTLGSPASWYTCCPYDPSYTGPPGASCYSTVPDKC